MVGAPKAAAEVPAAAEVSERVATANVDLGDNGKVDGVHDPPEKRGSSPRGPARLHHLLLLLLAH